MKKNRKNSTLKKMAVIINITGAVTIGALYTQQSLASSAPSKGVYLGAKSGYQLVHDDTAKDEPGSGIFGLYGGYRFDKSWSWDIGYQYHMPLEDNGIDVDSWLIESAARYDYALNKNWSLYTRLGLAYWDVEKNTINGQKSESGVSPLLEGGVGYAITPRWLATAGYQFVSGIGDEDSIGAYDSNAVMFSLAYQFGHSGPSQEELAKQKEMEQQSLVAEQEAEAIRQAEREAHNAEIARLQAEADTLKEQNDLDKRLTVFASETLDVSFASNSSVITAPMRDAITPSLEEVAAILAEHSEVEAHFIGHTDTSGSEQYNLWMSQKRARSMANELAAIRGTADRVHTKGLGESKATTENNPADRRVEIILTCESC